MKTKFLISIAIIISVVLFGCSSGSAIRYGKKCLSNADCKNITAGNPGCYLGSMTCQKFRNNRDCWYEDGFYKQNEKNPLGQTCIKGKWVFAVPNSCNDSDGGKNLNIKGSVVMYNNNVRKELVDYCSSNNKRVMEYWCDKLRLRGKLFTCPKGSVCSNGACVNDQINISCTDSDGGKNFFVKGVAKGIFGGEQSSFSDSCCSGSNCNSASGDRVLETYCDGQYIRTIIQNCTYGCNDGACQMNQTNFACYKDSDCGYTGLLNGYSCEGTTYYQNYTNSTCKFPGTANAKCIISGGMLPAPICDSRAGACQIPDEGLVIVGSDSPCGSIFQFKSVQASIDAYRLRNMITGATLDVEYDLAGYAHLWLNGVITNISGAGDLATVLVFSMQKDFACYKDSDCGLSGPIGYSCEGNMYYRNFMNITCMNPGTATAHCVNKPFSVLVENCGLFKTCTANGCSVLEPTCVSKMIELKPSGSYNYELEFYTKAKVLLSSEVFGYNGKIFIGRMLGSTARALVTSPDDPVYDEDYVLISDGVAGGYGRMLQFKSVQSSDDVYVLKDMATGESYDVKYNSSTGEGTLVVDGFTTTIKGGGDDATNLTFSTAKNYIYMQYGAKISILQDAITVQGGSDTIKIPIIYTAGMLSTGSITGITLTEIVREGLFPLYQGITPSNIVVDYFRLSTGQGAMEIFYPGFKCD
ncbi:hypothetical protein JXA85_02905 [Candidatus Woesearchaeota archaeon]|nr:hypothetical protein [Candidatus Woesearchaeota archaeon]